MWGRSFIKGEYNLYIRYDPNEPNGRRNAYIKLICTLIAIWGPIISAIFYLGKFIAYLQGSNSKGIFYSIFWYLFFGVVDYLFLRVLNTQKKKIAGKFFTIYIGGILDVTAIVAIIVSILSLYRKRTGIVPLVISIMTTLIISIAIWLLLQKLNGHTIKFFSNIKTSPSWEQHNYENKTNSFATQNSDEFGSVIYCHKCGKQLPKDSKFCNSCGTKLK